MVVARQLSYVDPILDLVLRQAPHHDPWLHLDPRHAAPPAHGSADELRLEIHASHVADLHLHRGRMEIPSSCDRRLCRRWPCGTLARLCIAGDRALRTAGTHSRA